MEKYNYLENVKNDLRAWIEEHMDYIPKGDNDTAQEYIYDETFISDSVTGNASGSYTCNAWEAEEFLCHNLDLLSESLAEFGSDVGEYIKSSESCDVTIRCHLLSQALSEVMDEYDFEEDEEDEESDDEE